MISCFFDIIKTFSKTYKYKVVNSNDFIQTVNRLTNADYSWFFNHYLYCHQAPELSYALSEDGELYYKWVNTHADFSKLKIWINDGEEEVMLIPSTQLQKIQLKYPDEFGTIFSFHDNVLFAFSRDKSLLKESE